MATRRERVVLELEDNFTAGMARAAVATQLLDRNLNSLSGSAVRSARSTDEVHRSSKRLGDTAGGSSRQIDRMSGRLRIMADVAAMLGPSLVPIGAVGIPAITGLAQQFGFAAAAGGVAVVAFQGVGNALGAMNKAHLEPTAANLEAARLAMQQLGPDARHLVRYLSGLTDEWHRLRDVAASGLFPGVERGLDALLTRAPEVISILDTIATTTGRILGDTGESFASSRWDEFFRFVDVRAPQALSDFARAIGNVTHGVAELVMAFDPLSMDFSSWLVRATGDFDRWADGLSRTEGFQEFVDYIRAVGPQVGETLGSLALALAHIVEAAAPIGAVTLPLLEAVADVVSMVADSDAGTPLLAMVAAMGLLSRATQAWGAVSKASATSFVGGQAQALRALMATIRGQQELNALTAAQRKGLGRTAGLAVGGGLLASGLASEIGATNTAMGIMTGTIAGPWGAAVGGAIGLIMDLSDSQEIATVSATELTDAIDTQTGALSAAGYEAIAQSLQQYSDVADEVGISLSEMTSAVVNGGPELDALQARIDNYINSFGTVWERSEAADKVGALSMALNGQNEEVNKAVEASHARQAAVDAAASADDRAASAAEAHARSVERLNRAVSALNNLLNAREQAREYEAALDDLTASVKENGQAWSREGPKGRANLAALDRVAKAAGNQIQTLTEKGKIAAAQRVATTAIADLRQFARENPKARNEVQLLIAKLKETDRQRAKPEVDVDAASALRKLGEVRASLASLRDKTITLRTIHMDTRIERGHAWGGYTGRGGKFEPAGTVHRGEVVLPQEVVQRDKSHLVSRYGYLPGMDQLAGYAGGGYVTSLLDRYGSLADSVASSFNAELFGSGLAGLDQALNSNRSGSSQMLRILRLLKKSGLDTTGGRGALFQALAASGDLLTAQQLLASGKSGIEHYESLYAQQARTRSQLGSFAADAAFGGGLRGSAGDILASRRRDQESLKLLAQIARILGNKLPKDMAHEITRVLNNAAANAKRGS